MKLYANKDFMTKAQVVKDPIIQDDIKKFLRRLKCLNSNIIIPELIFCRNNKYCKKISFYFLYLSIDNERAILVDITQK